MDFLSVDDERQAPAGAADAVPGEQAVCVSVVVPFHNAERHVESCITALLQQTYPASRYEILLVDNNSTDRSAALASRHPRVRLLSEKKQGAYAARNLGSTVARGDVLAFTDADCVPSPGWLSEIVRALDAPGVEVVLGGRRYATDAPLLSMLEAYETERAARVFSWKRSGLYFGYTNNMGVRRSTFERHGPFLEVPRGADSLFVQGVVKDRTPDAVRFVPEASVRHLEMSSTWRWLHKKFLYGRSLQHNLQRRDSYRVMTGAETRSILSGALRSADRSRFRQAGLVFLVALGSLCFLAGRASARLRGSPSAP